MSLTNNNQTERYCVFQQCDETIIEAGLCSCANRFYEVHKYGQE